MDNGPVIDPMVLFFERQGFFLTIRQLEFCRFMLKHGDAVKAARLSDYPEPKDNGPALYGMFLGPLNAWREETNFDYNLALGVYRRQAQAENKIISNAAEVAASAGDIEVEYDHVPNERVAGKGADGLCRMLGFNAAQGLDVNLGGSVELPVTLREKLDNAYKQDSGK
jgi:hypothetical protein